MKTESQERYDCAQIMIDHITDKSKPIVKCDVKVNPIRPHHLLDTLATAKIKPSFYKNNKPLTSLDFKQWANALQNRQHDAWLDRKYHNTTKKVELSWLLECAFNHYLRLQDIKDTQPTDKNVFDYLTQYINTYSTCDPHQNVTIESMRNSVRHTNTVGIDNPNIDVKDYEFTHWSKVLRERFAFRERRPIFEIILKEGRRSWQKKRSANLPTKDSTNSQPQNNRVVTGGGVPHMRSIFSDIEIEEGTNDLMDSANTKMSIRCDFCHKEATLHPRNSHLLHYLKRNNRFFCPFCVRHDFNTRKQRHVFIFTMRALIGYLYHTCYFGKAPKLYLSQITEMIDNHAQIGILNPVFSYDPDSYCWFVDFTKVGPTKNKIPLNEVINTTIEIQTAFNPYEYIKDFKGHKYSQRFIEAIQDFHQRRFRPKDKHICAPTLTNCAYDTREATKTANNKKLDLTTYRDFTPNKLRLHKTR